jgi:hypothetical protein
LVIVVQFSLKDFMPMAPFFHISIGFMLSSSVAAKPRAARQLEISVDNIDTVKCKLSACRLNLQQAQAKVSLLMSQLSRALQKVSDVNSTQSSAGYRIEASASRI